MIIIHINDLFYIIEKTDICNFANDTTPSPSVHDLQDLMDYVEYDCITLAKWFRDTFLLLNADRCNVC